MFTIYTFKVEVVTEYDLDSSIQQSDEMIITMVDDPNCPLPSEEDLSPFITEIEGPLSLKALNNNGWAT